MPMNEHDDAYVDAMLMVNMQANTRSVTIIIIIIIKISEVATSDSNSGSNPRSWDSNPS